VQARRFSSCEAVASGSVSCWHDHSSDLKGWTVMASRSRGCSSNSSCSVRGRPRQLQDSRFWQTCGSSSRNSQRSASTPDHAEQGEGAAETAHELNKLVRGGPRRRIAEHRVSPGIVAARLTFEEVIRFVLPMTFWWSESRIADAMKGYLTNVDSLVKDFVETRKEAENGFTISQGPRCRTSRPAGGSRSSRPCCCGRRTRARSPGQEANAEGAGSSARHQDEGKEAAIVQTLTQLFPGELPRRSTCVRVDVSLNRRATPALFRSVRR